MPTIELDHEILDFTETFTVVFVVVVQGLFGEVSSDEVGAVVHQEVRSSLFDSALDRPEELGWHLAHVTLALENVKEQSLEG